MRQRYPALRDWPARAPRLIAALLPSSTLPLYNRVGARDRRVLAYCLSVVLLPRTTSSSAPLPSHPKPSSPAPPNNTIVVDNHRRSKRTICGYREGSNVERKIHAAIPPSPERRRNSVKTISEKGKCKGGARSPTTSPVLESPPSPEIEFSPELVDCTPTLPRPQRQGIPTETSSKRGKEKARARTPPPYPEVELAPSLLSDDDIGTQVAFIESITPPIPQRDIVIGEAGPSNILRSPSPPSPSRPLLSLVPRLTRQVTMHHSIPSAPGLPPLSCSPMPRYIRLFQAMVMKTRSLCFRCF